MCNCIETTEEALVKRITDNSKQKKFKDFTITNGYLENKPAYMFKGEIKLFSPFKYKYTFTKTNGETSTEKTGSVNIFYNYCPFCGAKYD